MTTSSTALSGLLTTLTDSLTSATSSFPSPLDSLFPPADGISLLDTKNDLLLSYLQNIVFLIILKLRDDADSYGKGDSVGTLGHETAQKLIESRVYLEKGVRPLEGRLRYQIDKVLRAAHDEDRRLNAQRDKDSQGRGGKSAVQSSRKATTGQASDASDSDSASADSEHTSSSHKALPSKIDDLSYRPNPAALFRKPNSSGPSKSYSSKAGNTGTYQPPRIAPKSMPDHPSSTVARSSNRNRKSHLLDEYISTELSSAPQAEPSIGSNSTILRRGGGALSARDREKEKERVEYEERNFSRLPSESKAERRKGRAGVRERDNFGGEDWTGLGAVGDQVARSVARGSRAAREGREGVLGRREKRRRDASDVAGGAGAVVRIGENFEKRRKILEGRAERKRKSR